MQQVVGARDRLLPRHAMHARAERDGVLDGQPRVERRVVPSLRARVVAPRYNH